MQTLSHFAINADDTNRAKRFYERVFGWTIAPWGPPGFYQIAGGGVHGALQQRRELVAGRRTIGFECTIGVESIDDTARAVVANGGRTIMDKSVIVGVGTLMFFEDTEGNVFGAMQYDAGAE